MVLIPNNTEQNMTTTMTTTTMSTDQYAQVAAQIKQLLQETKATRRHDDRADAARLDELRRVFRNVAQEGDFDTPHTSSSQHGDDNDTNDDIVDDSSSARITWRAFLKKSFAKMIQQLMNRITVGGKRTAIRTLWAVIANFPIKQTLSMQSSTTQTTTAKRTVDIINVDLLTQWIRAITTTPSLVWKDQSVQHMIQAEFVGPFRDVQYYTMIAISLVANQLYNNHQLLLDSNKDDKKDEKDKQQYAQQAERLVQLLMMIPIVTSQKELVYAKGESASSKYLFCPPPPSNAASVTGVHDENDSDDESQEESDDDDDDDDDESSKDSGGSSSSSSEDDDKKKSSKNTASHSSLMSFQRKSDHVRVWGKAWLAVLRLPCLPTRMLQHVLQFLPSHVLNIVSNPLQFADFFMQAYSMTTTSHHNLAAAALDDKSSSSNDNDNKEEKDKCQQQQPQQQHHQTSTTTSIIPILALDGLFLLMTKHGLEYPNYYQQLYRLITVPLFYYKKSTNHQFFLLLEKSLVYNELLPAHVVAAFMKRLARCALNAPPATILVALALISNVLRKHPETACLIQKASASSSSSSSKNDKNNDTKNNIMNNNNNDDDDAFDARTDNPVQARALQSSLWELQALTHHYHAAVATLADSIGRVEETKVPPHVLPDFTRLNYKSLFETDRKRAAVVVINSNNDNNNSANTNTNNNNNSATAANDDKDNKKSKKRKRNASTTTTTALTFARPDNGLFGNSGDVLAGLLDMS